MKTIKTKWLACAGFVFAAITFVAWKSTDDAQTLKPDTGHIQKDTTPVRKRVYDKQEYKIGDLDEALKELDRARIELNDNVRFDLSKIDKELKKAIKEIDFDRISQEITASLKKVDWEKTKLDIEKAVHQADIQLKELDMKHIEKQIDRARESIDAAKISSRIDMDRIRQSVAQGIASANVGIEYAKKEITQLKEFINALDKEGLINKKKGFRIEIKDKKLYINGTRQSQEVNDKYRKYFKGEDYIIEDNGDDVSRI
jgi:hypothetical protein